MIIHPIHPIYNENSRVLILGTFPSVKSREEDFFYGHPQNRFWRVMAFVCNCKCPQSIEEKTAMLLNNHFALWDVIHSCEIEGSADSTIKNVIPNDIKTLIEKTKIDKVFVNGKKAESLYKKYIEKEIGIRAIVLPSTSPANASWNLDKLCNFWKLKILDE